MTLQTIFEKVKMENARSKEIYGLWQGKYTSDQQAEAIVSEFTEWYKAHIDGDIDGPHGELVEAVQTIGVLCRRIMFLTGEFDA